MLKKDEYLKLTEEEKYELYQYYALRSKYMEAEIKLLKLELEFGRI